MAFSRRTLLRYAAGAGAGGLLGPLMSRIAGGAQSSPCRFLFVVEGNGFEPVTMLADSARAKLDAINSGPVGTKRWWYRDYRSDALEIVDGADLYTAPALGALQTQGLVGDARVIFGLSSKIIGGGHSGRHGVLSSARTVGSSPGGPTIDAHLAALPGVRASTPFDAVRLGVTNGSRALDFNTVAFGKNRPAPMLLNPSNAYEVLFGSVGSTQNRRNFAARSELLTFAHNDVQAALNAFGGSTPERAKLEAYLASIDTLQARHARLSTLGGALAQYAPTDPANNPLHQSTDALDQFAAQMEIATAALQGELTNVVVVGSGTGGAFNLRYSSVTDVIRHDMHHGSANDPALRNAIHDVTRRQVDIIAGAAKKLADTPDPAGGSMLDHTVVVFIGDNGEQHHSTASDFPILMIGGAAMGLSAGGRTFLYPGLGRTGHLQVSNVWNTLGHAAGEDLNEFGEEGPTRNAAGPLSDLLS